MKTVTIRNLEIGSGRPKIAVPIVGQTKEAILKEAKSLLSLPVDLAEWRADWFSSVSDADQVLDVLQELRSILGDLPLLMTFRTKQEGGERDISPEDYRSLNLLAAKSGLVDLIDTELFLGEELVRSIIHEAHEFGVKVIASNHDFSKTPEKSELIRRLCLMQQYQADILKIAVMPQNKKDVLTLLSATEEMVSQYADRPVVTMSMSRTGVISRLCGECFGSAVTFGSAGQSSAPGQIDAASLYQLLNELHHVL